MVVVSFETINGCERRVIVQDLVGGYHLNSDPYMSPSSGLKKWWWPDPSSNHKNPGGTQARLVTDMVIETAPVSAESEGAEFCRTFPPDGGHGDRFLARWSWWPKEGQEGDGELLFPRGAEVREVVDVNGDWFWGVYAGVGGLVPSPYVRLVE